MTISDPTETALHPLLDLKRSNGDLVLVRDAFVIPPAPGATAGRLSTTGVLDANGCMVEQSISWSRSNDRVNQAPEIPDASRRMAGRYIFGGVLYGHFGHFIVESLARMWALDAEGVEAQGMIFTPKVLTLNDKAIPKLQHLAALLGLRVPIVVAREPLQVDELYVPAQGFGMNDLIVGSEVFRDFINRHAGKSVAPNGPEKLYISRSQLPRDRGSVLGEYKLEEYLQAEGYDVFHPQRHAPEEQIARYKAAKLIVGVDCSPIHMLGYVGNSDQNTAIVLRRSMNVGAFLSEQLRLFKGMRAQEHDFLLDDWFPLPGNRPSRSSWGEIDFTSLHAALLASGHISNPAPWPKLTAGERAAELARIEAMHGTTFRSYKEFRETISKAR